MDMSMIPEELKTALKEFYGEAVTNLVCQNFVLNRECIKLENELTEIKAKLHQVQCNLLAAQGKAIIDEQE